MNDRELSRERRRQRALERLGSNHPRCVICGHDDPLALDLHHIAGRGYSDEQAPVCRNCHPRLSDDQKDHPSADRKPPTTSESAGHFLLGLADLFELVVKWLRDYATKLLAIDAAPSASTSRDRS